MKKIVYKNKKESMSKKITSDEVLTQSNNKIGGSVKKLDKYTFIFNDRVDSDSINELILELNQALKQLEDDTSIKEEDKKIILYINSPGGDVIEGLRAVNFIQKAKYPIYGVVNGVAASMAVSLLLACHRRFTEKYSYILVHEIRGGIAGKYSEIKDQMSFVEKLEEDMAKLYLEKTNLNAEDLKIMTQRETQLNAKEAISYGFVEDYQK